MRTAFKGVIFTLPAVLLVSLWVTPAYAQPSLPHAFYGTLTCGGSPAPVGTLVTAKVSGETKGYIVTTVAGWYGGAGEGDDKLVVQNANSGDTIYFYISNAYGEVLANETATFQGGGQVTELNLTSAALPAPPVPPPPTVNTPICTANDTQQSPRIISDGSGGAIIAWSDSRSGNQDIYAQRMDSSGNVTWTADGVAISTTTGNQVNPEIVSVGSGGAIITWSDNRTGNSDIYAQRVDASGITLWTTNGVAVCTAADKQVSPKLVTDGSDGAIITWWDKRSDSGDVYVQRVEASGNTTWAADGVAVSVMAQQQAVPELVSDGSGGAIITWHDTRTAMGVYAQRVDTFGNALWTVNGVAICATGAGTSMEQIVSDGSGGAISTWVDLRNDNKDIYTQRVASSGNILWLTDGIAVSTAADIQNRPKIASDGSGGAIIVWEDGRNGNTDIYAQRVDASGNAHISLGEGWNMFSTPFPLESGYSTWGQLKTISGGLNANIAYYYDPDYYVSGVWLPWRVVTDSYQITPCDAIYVHMSAADNVSLVASTVPSVPSKALSAGWNLMGLGLYPDTTMQVDQALTSVYTVTGDLTGYAVVVSPALNQTGWIYLRDADGTGKNMRAGEGYWVFMVNPGTLAGFTTTPLP